jgi:hypothetical protein
MAVFVAQLGLSGELFSDCKDFIPALGRSFAKFGQPLDEFDPGSGRIESQEDDDRSLLVHLRQAGDQVNKKAFRIGPCVIKLAYEQQYVVKAGHRFCLLSG